MRIIELDSMSKSFRLNCGFSIMNADEKQDKGHYVPTKLDAKETSELLQIHCPDFESYRKEMELCGFKPIIGRDYFNLKE